MFKNTLLRQAINANIAGILLMDSKILCSLFVQFTKTDFEQFLT